VYVKTENFAPCMAIPSPLSRPQPREQHRASSERWPLSRAKRQAADALEIVWCDD